MFDNCCFLVFFTILLVAVQVWISGAVVMDADLSRNRLWHQQLGGAVVQQLLQFPLIQTPCGC